MSDLSTGQGLCRGEARLLIRPVQAVIELGAAEDVLQTTLRALHHANRYAASDDFIAAALPGMRAGRETVQPGHNLVLVGSETALAALMRLEGMEKLKRRGMLLETEVTEHGFDPGETGAAYIRDRAVEKHTAGWIRRSRARAERRGKPMGRAVRPQRDSTDTLLLAHGAARLHIREVIGTWTGAPLHVSTYGFSAAANPAFLPVFPEVARERDDAA